MVKEGEEVQVQESLSPSASDYLGDTYLSCELVNHLGLVGNQVISRVVPVGFKNEDGTEVSKLSIGFKGCKGYLLALNQTNGKTMKNAFGDLWADWKDKKVEVSIIKGSYKGKPCDQTILTAIKPK